MPCRLLEERDVTLYCDLHGHSRKQNVFIYGCENRSDPLKRLRERVFPVMISKNAPTQVILNVEGNSTSCHRLPVKMTQKRSPLILDLEAWRRDDNEGEVVISAWNHNEFRKFCRERLTLDENFPFSLQAPVFFYLFYSYKVLCSLSKYWRRLSNHNEDDDKNVANLPIECFNSRNQWASFSTKTKERLHKNRIHFPEN